MRVWDAVAEVLRKEGVEYLFNYPATPLIDACARVGIRPVICRQERVGVGMADGYSRVSGGRRVGVFAMQSGPGVENAFAGVATAYADASPVLVLPLGPDIGQARIPPSFDAAAAFHKITKHFETVTAPELAVDAMRRAFGHLRGGRLGPVMIEIPADVGLMEIADERVQAYRPVVMCRSTANATNVSAAAAALLAAKRPVIYAGQGVLYAGASAELAELADLVVAPVATTLEGMSAFSERHPLALGTATITNRTPVVEFVREADCIIGVGTSMTKGDLAIDMPADATMVQITNNAGDLHKSYNIDYPVLGDAKLVLRDLIDACHDMLGGEARDSAELGQRIAARFESWIAEWTPKLTSGDQPMTPYRVIGDFMKVVDSDDAIVTHDCGSPRHQITPFYRPSLPHSYLGWGKSHALGTGVGLMMGAKLAAPEKLCVHFMGDAAFGMTGLDLETAVRCGIPTLSIVLNNSTMANESWSMVVSHEKYRARDIGGDFSEVAKGLGLWAERVTDPDEVIPALRRARAAAEGGQAALLDCVTSAETDMSHYLDLHVDMRDPAVSI